MQTWRRGGAALVARSTSIFTPAPRARQKPTVAPAKQNRRRGVGGAQPAAGGERGRKGAPAYARAGQGGKATRLVFLAAAGWRRGWRAAVLFEPPPPPRRHRRTQSRRERAGEGHTQGEGGSAPPPAAVATMAWRLRHRRQRRAPPATPIKPQPFINSANHPNQPTTQSPQSFVTPE